MAGKSNFINLTSANQKTIKDTCSAAANDAKTACKKLRGELEKILNRTKYEPIQNYLNNLITTTHNDGKAQSIKIIDSLKGEGQDFAGHTKIMEAGEKALAVATKMDTVLKDTVVKFWGDKPLGEIFTVDTSETKVNEADFDELKKLFSDAVKACNDYKKTHIDKLEKDPENSPTTSVAVPIIISILGTLEESFTGFMEKIDKYKEEAVQKGHTQRQISTQTKGMASTQASKGKELASKLSMFSKGGTSK